MKKVIFWFGDTIVKCGKKIRKLGIVKEPEKEIIPQHNMVLQQEIEGFYNVTNDILIKHENETITNPVDFTYVTPFVVNACFCCESIIQNHLLSNAIKSQKTHKLKVLLDKLDKKVRNEIIRDTLNNFYSSSITNVSKKDRSKFIQLLDPFNEAYVEYRYAYYSNPTEFKGNTTTNIRTLNGNLNFLKTFMDVLKVKL
ncbi:hypothetical protein [Haloplasma contractile]|uniref:HEPN domain-containing protein n=1 Tax=Haloplasma contractile SSD-17B TaxID=1033810 RepID=F7Q1Q7_9MOLU|nr:hypothetical protein [Haloplasma contractile]ERJ12280.1 hypothetical protein HLPCO_001807 [Haloplasma contractile SSD-17B]